MITKSKCGAAAYPCGLSEAEVLCAIDQALSNLGKIYKFGYHQRQDIEQEGRLFALEVLRTGKYDCAQPLPNFLFIHIRNRLSNMKRDKFRRNDPPCILCHTSLAQSMPSECGEATTGCCPKYEAWRLRNAAKQNLMNTLGLSVIDENSDYLIYEDAVAFGQCEAAEAQAALDQLLPQALRKLYLKARSGCKLTKSEKLKLCEALKGTCEEQS